MKRLAGTPNPRSWKGIKLTTYPGDGDGLTPLPGAIHSSCGSSERGRSKPSATRASRSPRKQSRMATGHAAKQQTPCQPSPDRSSGGGRDEVCGFLSSGYSLRLRKPKQEASANGRVESHRRPRFRVYKGPDEDYSKLRLNPSRNSNSEGKRSFCSSDGPRTRNRRPANRPSRRINSLAEQAIPLAGEAGDVTPLS
jgi:hypothetical protein